MGLIRSQDQLGGLDKPIDIEKTGPNAVPFLLLGPFFAAGAGSAGLQESLVSQARGHSPNLRCRLLYARRRAISSAQPLKFSWGVSRKNGKSQSNG